MYNITLKNGITYAADWCGEFEGVLSARIQDETATLPELADTFSDEKATDTIIFSTGNHEIIFNGFTSLILIQDQRWQHGGLIIQLRRKING